MLMDIAEVARRAGVPASTLRFYEEKGLVAAVGRRGLRRLFESDILGRLSLIALGQSAGFSLKEIGAMFAPDGRPRIDRAKLAAKADELDGTIRRLTAMRDGLRHAAACPARTHMECPTFRRMLKKASGRLVRGARTARRSTRCDMAGAHSGSAHRTGTAPVGAIASCWDRPPDSHI
jgi:DNA-binding transcriptional MerR regulator